MSAEQGPPERVAVFRALQLGDMLCAVPMLRSLRNGLPDASITLVGLPWAEAFAKRFRHLVDEFSAFPGFPGLPEQPSSEASYRQFVRTMRARRFDLAIQAHGSGEITNGIVAAFGAARVGGFCPATAPPVIGSFLPFPGGNEILRLTALTRFLGFPDAGSVLELPLEPEEQRSASQLLNSLGVHGGRYVCIHPGARFRSRRWPIERFAAVARELAGRGLDVVVTGTASEQPLAAAIERTVPGVVSVAGRTGIGELASVIRGAALLISNDTGVSHIAAALRTPSVVIACGSDAARWSPLDVSLHRVLAAEVDCRPCGFVDCPIGHVCATAIEVGDVLGAAFARLHLNAPASA